MFFTTFLPALRAGGICLLVTGCMASNAIADPPRVVKAIPDDGEMDVDPSTRELRVTFDQDMNRGGMSVVGGGPTFPANPSARPTWVDARTIVMPLRLSPGRDYQLSINSARFRNFRSVQGEPAMPYPIRFRTGNGKGKGAVAKLTKIENRRAIDRLKKALNEDYSYHDLRGVDWDEAFRKESDHLLTAGTSMEFAKRAAALLAPAKDMHLWLKVGDLQVSTFDRKVSPNFNLSSIEKKVPDLKSDGPVSVGRFPDGITYILIAAWSPDVASRLNLVYEAIGKADANKGLILDVRPNGGGAEPLAREVAGCFLDSPKVYAKHIIRKGGTFLPIHERTVSPNREHRPYRGKVAVLMDPSNMSSCESFLLMMRQVHGCKLVGGQSYGSSGNPQPVDLGNGVTAFVPSWKVLLLDGSSLEGVGITPDETVNAEPGAFSSGDPVLDAALASLRKS